MADRDCVVRTVRSKPSNVIRFRMVEVCMSGGVGPAYADMARAVRLATLDRRCAAQLARRHREGRVRIWCECGGIHEPKPLRPACGEARDVARAPLPDPLPANVIVLAPAAERRAGHG